MAISINAGKVGRQDLFSIDPAEIVVEESDNGRAVPHTEDALVKLAASILHNGQLQPVLVRRIADNRVQLVAGYGRYKAVKRINEHGGDDGTPILLQCRVVDCNEEEAFVKNIAENNDRQTTCPMDDAYNQRRLRERFAWTDEQVSTFYECSVSHIRSLRKALRFPKKVREAVANGSMALSAALKVADLPEKEQVAAVAEATDPETGRVNGTAIRETVRRRRQEEGKGEGRTLAEVRKFFTGLMGDQAASVRTLAERVLEFAAGKLTDEQMTEAMKENCA